MRAKWGKIKDKIVLGDELTKEIGGEPISIRVEGKKMRVMAKDKNGNYFWKYVEKEEYVKDVKMAIKEVYGGVRQ